MIAAAKAYRIDDLSEWEVPRVDSNIYQAYKQFTRDVDHFTTRLRIRHTPRKRRSSVGLDEDTKEKIRNCVEKIRKIIGNADLPESKRESLYTKLNEFSLELDKNRTGLAAGMAVYIAICDGIGRGFEKLEPARRFIDSIAALLGKAKDLEDAGQPKLPSPTERKRLEPSRKALPKPEPRKDELDDVPF